MNIINRRDFLVRLGGFAALPFWQSGPNLILYNANIITVDPKQPRAQALAILGNYLLAVGENQKIQALATSSTKQINLEGKTVVPGFIDAHTHPAYAGRFHLKSVDCGLTSISDILQALRKKASATRPGEWVQGFKYDDTKTKEGRFLNRDDLDQALPNHPAYVVHRGGHTAYVNSLALKAAGVSEAAPDPQGGQYGRDPKSGKLTGRLLEKATEPFHHIVPADFTRAEQQAAVTLVAKMMSCVGITSVHDAFGSPTDLLAYQDSYRAGDLPLRVYCFIGYPHLDEMIRAGLRTGLGDEWVRVGGVKLVCDGSISERTARLSQPYIGRPDDFGILVMDEDEIYARASTAHAADWQIGTHANGDVAIEKVLNVYERLQRERPRADPRFRIEHCTVITPEIIRRMKSLNIIPNPFSTYIYYHGEKMKEYGSERLERMFAVRSFLDAGIPVTQTSDYTPGPFEPMMALQSSVTRTSMKGELLGGRQRVTVDEALRVGTLHGARASFEEDIKGSLTPGKLADLVVLGQDPTKVDPFALIKVPVERTMAGGRWVYEA